MVLIAVTLALGYVSFQSDPSVQRAPVAIPKPQCTSCEASLSPAVMARLQSLPDLETPAGRFQYQVQDGRDKLISLGRSPNELIVTPNTRIQWTNPKGVVIAWNFDTNGYVSLYEQGDCQVAYTRYADGNVEQSAMKLPEARILDFRPVLHMTENSQGYITQFTWLPTGQTFPVTFSPSGPVVATTSQMVSFQRAHTGDEIRKHNHDCNLTRYNASLDAHAAEKKCQDAANAEIPSDIGKAFAIWGGCGGIGAGIGAGIGVWAGGLGAAPGAGIGGLIGLGVGVPTSIITEVADFWAHYDLCHKNLITDLDLAQRKYLGCIWTSRSSS